MEYNKFKKYLKEIVSLKEDVDALNKPFKKLNPDFNYISFCRHEDLMVKLLEEAIKNKHDEIGYFIYEMDCKFSKKSIGQNEDGNPIFIRNYRDLYNLITK